MVLNPLKINESHFKKLPTPFKASDHLKKLLQVIEQAGGKGVLVGGCVRDHLLNITPKDLDIEVYGLTKETLNKILTKHFEVIPVGVAFGIYKVFVSIDKEKRPFDVSLPRSESKCAPGHRGFVISKDPFMPYEKASSRRDFTINSMAIDLKKQLLIDPFDGLKDLNNKVLRHISKAFREDPLRVLRAAQFCARFELRLHKDTKEECIALKDELNTLSKERIFEEYKKLLLSKKPSIGFEVLRKTKAIDLTPELKALIDCKQEPKWHPEGDVWIHTLMVCDACANILCKKDLEQNEKLIIMTGALCHDFGKPLTTIRSEGLIKSPGHEQAGIDPTISFLERIGFIKKYFDDVTSLVKEHLKPFQLYKKRNEVKDGAIRRLCARVNIDRLLIVSHADFLGRTTKEAISGKDPSVGWLKNKINNIMGEDKKPKPLLFGRHLIDLGLSPGPSFSKILNEAFEAQLDGDFSDLDGAIKWVKEKLNINTNNPDS